MDEYSGKRAARRLVIPGKGSGLVLRDAAERRDRDEQFCNRLGCNGRIKYTKSAQNGCSEKFKSSRPSHASSGKEIIGSSARTSSVVAKTRKSLLESRKKLSSQLEPNSPETVSVQDEPEVLDVVPSSGRVKIGSQSALDDAETGKVKLMEVRSSSLASNIRTRKVFRRNSGVGTQDAPLGSSVPLASKSTCQGARNSGSASRYGLSNLRGNSISGVVPSGCSSFESNNSRRKDTVKERNAEVESSSCVRGRKMTEPLSKDGRSSTFTHGIPISDSRRARNWFPSQSNVVGSDRIRRSINGNTRTRLSNCGYGNRLLPTELPVVTPQVPRPELPIAADVSCSSSGGGSSPEIMRAGPNFPTDLGITCSLMNRDLWRHNMDGNAEEHLLLALQRIEHDEELTFEQLLALETNIFRGGFGFYDQHQDLRLDIDTMSYEELLDLEEKMGTVSTALSEEELSKCLKRTTYQPIPPEGAMGCSGNENCGKCSICQEEYVVGDEVGRLECEHGYHAVCINEWLHLKNWCPICKASAAPPSLSSSSSSYS